MSSDRWLALSFLAISVLIVFVWIPLDTESGLIEKERRKFVIGDALAPTITGAIIALGAFLTWLRPGRGHTISSKNVIWILLLLTIFIISLVIVRYAGPVSAMGFVDGYRPLRATPPWSYIGFLLGGTAMIGGLTSAASRRLSIRGFAVGFAASLIIALLYDLPFDDLLLPPNGDV
ncbi:MAG: hypothetical protein OXF74_09930 [Rhodobacteraceae bacterium]|nr:hypothetical protein [Paracoccaceae bacterium]